MKKLFNNHWALIIILIIAAALRFWRLPSIPPSLSWDEVAIGYNAWSILKTGADEYGTRLPLLFRSFEDYKLPGLVYLTVLSESVFGLNEMGVRFPSAFFGVLFIVIGYLFGKELFGKKAGYVTAFLMAVNPWLIYFSRQSFESNVSSFFVFTGAYCLARYKNKAYYLIVAAVCFAISIYFYYSARLVLFFVVFSFAIIYKKELIKSYKISILSFFAGFFILLPLLPNLFSIEGFSRISQINITNDARFHERVDRYVVKMGESSVPIIAPYMYHRYKALFDEFVLNYLRNISPDFLFFGGTWVHGLFYLFEIITIPIGLYILVKRKNKDKWVLLAYLLVFPISAALTKDQPNSLRTLVGAPVLTLVSSIGLFWLIEKVKQCKYAFYYYGIGVALFAAFFSYFLYTYFVLQPKIRAHDFGDGHKQMVKYLRKVKDDYDTIWVTGDYWRPYIHVLFHLGYDPSKYQESGSRYQIENIHFGGEWDDTGVQLGLVDINKYRKGETLFILSDREYRMRKDKGEVFYKELPIDGAVSPHEFWAVEL